MRDSTSFSRLLRHPARKRCGSILTTPEPAWAWIEDTIQGTLPGTRKTGKPKNIWLKHHAVTEMNLKEY